MKRPVIGLGLKLGVSIGVDMIRAAVILSCQGLPGVLVGVLGYALLIKGGVQHGLGHAPTVATGDMRFFTFLGWRQGQALLSLVRPVS